MIRLGVCEICENEPAKYTCPACETHSCSLSCVTEHKNKLDCDGVRPRTGYVPLDKFTDLDLLNDYRLLEEVGRRVEKYSRDKTKRYTRVEQSLPLHLHRLKRAVMHRGTRYYLLPENFARHKNNTTYFDWKSKQISWRLQLTFLNAGMLTYHEDRCPESTSLEDIISKYVSLPALRHYRIAGLNSIHVLMKAEKVSGTSNRFYKLNLKNTLKGNLYGKSVVEYPQLFVVIQNFYSSKTEAEKKVQKESNAIKHNDFLQLKGAHEKMKSYDCEKTSEGDGTESSEGESTNEAVLGYRNLIQS